MSCFGWVWLCASVWVPEGCAGECEWVELWVCQRPPPQLWADTFSVHTCVMCAGLHACAGCLHLCIHVHIHRAGIQMHVCVSFMCVCILCEHMCMYLCLHACRSIM